MGDTGNILIGAGTVSIAGVDVGFTSGGVRLRLLRDTWLRPSPSGLGYSEVVKLNESFMIVTQLSEATITNIKRAWDIQISDLQESGYSSFRFGGHSDVTVNTLTFYGKAPGSNKKREVGFYRCSAVEFGDLIMRRGQETVVPTTFQILADSTKDNRYSMGYIKDET